MRIWYQSVMLFDRLPAYGAALQRQADRVASPGVEVWCRGTSKGGFADQFRFFEHFETRDIADVILRLRKKDPEVDALVIGNFLDPFLVAAREILDIPVIGLGETSMLLACMMGHRFALISPNRKFAHVIEENVRRYGLEGRMAWSDSVEFHIPDIDRAFTDPAVQEEMREQFFAAAERSIANGAEVLIPAGGVLMVLLEEMNIRDVNGVPILNGSAAAIKTAETAVALQRLGYSFTSRAGLYRQPTAEMIAQAGNVYDIDIA